MNNEDVTTETLTKIIEKFQNHQSIMKIKRKYLIQETFSFQPVTLKDVETNIKNFPKNKASGRDIPIPILKQRCVGFYLSNFNELHMLLSKEYFQIT